MLSSSLKGVTLMTPDRQPMGDSQIAAREGISKVVVSRMAMAAPGMVMIPFVMNSLERKGMFKRRPWIAAPLQVKMALL